MVETQFPVATHIGAKKIRLNNIPAQEDMPSPPPSPALSSSSAPGDKPHKETRNGRTLCCREGCQSVARGKEGLCQKHLSPDKKPKCRKCFKNCPQVAGSLCVKCSGREYPKRSKSNNKKRVRASSPCLIALEDDDMPPAPPTLMHQNSKDFVNSPIFDILMAEMSKSQELPITKNSAFTYHPQMFSAPIPQRQPALDYTYGTPSNMGSFRLNSAVYEPAPVESNMALDNEAISNFLQTVDDANLFQVLLEC